MPDIITGENHAIMMAIKNPFYRLLEFARQRRFKKKKPLKIRGLVSSVCQAAPAAAS
ncbi:hypothetical protein GTP58_06475 [Duganella sp. CY15W]|uniref:hypothetical protein n=1 Tax=Duganella sp. CY15W TaxID=2692172 RepID=UPI0013719B69|nr:hypothetical protein [Duganella sp. CY15W]MYM27963.1 hypothetical protein [Duganella sp. CY15W]